MPKSLTGLPSPRFFVSLLNCGNNVPLTIIIFVGSVVFVCTVLVVTFFIDFRSVTELAKRELMVGVVRGREMNMHVF